MAFATTIAGRTSPLRRRRRLRDAAAVGAALCVHLAILAAVLLVRAQPQPPRASPLVELAEAPPPVVVAKPTRQSHAGGSPATAPKRARPSAPRPQPSLAPPERPTPLPPVETRPLPTPAITAPRGPDLASPVTGAGAGAATGGNGPGTGTGAGGPGALAVEDPRWVSSPDPDVVERFYPLDAYRDGRGGEVELSCRELTDGRVKDCRVTSERPLSQGFGPAALKLSRFFRFVPAREDGRAVQARIRIPYAFSVEE